MQILVLLPEQAKQSSRPADRRYSAFAALGHATEQVLGRLLNGGTASFSATRCATNVVSDESWLESLIRSLANADLVINCAGVNHSNLTSHFSGPLISVSELFPDSFCQNSIRLDRNLDASAHFSTAGYIATDAHPNDYQTVPRPELHYAQFAPSPPNSDLAGYQRTGKSASHAVAVFSYTSAASLGSDIAKDKSVLAKLSGRYAMMSTLSIIVSTDPDTGISNKRRQSIIRELQTFASNQLKLRVDLPTASTDRYRELYACLGKADVALFANSDLYTDALSLGLPVYTWRDSTQRIISLNHFWDVRNINTEPYQHRELVAQRQLSAFTAQLNTLHTHAEIIDNNSQAFEKALVAIVHKISDGAIYMDTEITDSTESTELLPFIRELPERTTRQLFIHTWARRRRKLKKLTQSPTRFIQDSDNEFIRRLAARK